MKERQKRKNDRILIAAIVMIAAVFYVVNTFVVHQKGQYVTVTVDGAVYGTYSLAVQQEAEINGTNTFVIRDGSAKMTAASCPDQLCVHQKAVRRNKETIVCLPNKVVLEVTSAEESEYDAITGRGNR